MFWRFFSTSLRSAKALSVEDWAALNTAFPSNITIARIAFFTGSAVVGAVEALQLYHSSVLQGNMDAKTAELQKNMDAKTAELQKTVMGKLSSIEEQLAKMQVAQVPGKGVGSK